MVPYRRFYEVLARLKESTDSDWAPTLAGLVVLKLIDQWLDIGVHMVTSDVSRLVVIRDAIDAIAKTSPMRRMLTDIVDTMEHAEHPRVQSLTPLRDVEQNDRVYLRIPIRSRMAS